MLQKEDIQTNLLAYPPNQVANQAAINASANLNNPLKAVASGFSSLTAKDNQQYSINLVGKDFSATLPSCVLFIR